MSRRIGSFLVACVVVVPAIACAQSLDRRVAAADGNVQFHFAAREGVCGNGRSFVRAENAGYYTSMGTDGSRNQCDTGPVRVVLVRYGREIVKIETYAGPLAADADDGRDLGAVPAREASSYLLGLAGSLDGRPARDAMLPAMLADSTVVTPQLLAMAKDVSRSRDIRQSAISWMSRRRAETGGVGAASVAKTLEEMVHDRGENESIRQQALSTINSLDRGEGVPAMIQFAGESEEWLSRQAFSTLARSGDPRARQFVRDAIKRGSLSDEKLVSAIQGLGSDYASELDYKMLRDLYASLNSDRSRDALLQVLATGGGSQNATWLLAVANSTTEPAARRRRAVSLLGRFDDPRIKEALKGMIEH